MVCVPWVQALHPGAPWGSQEPWEAPPGGLLRREGQRGGSGALVLNSSLACQWSGFLICSASTQARVGILLMETSPSFFCKQTTFLRWGGRGPWAPPRVMLPRWGRMTDPGESSWQGCARTCSSDFLESSEVTRRWPPLGQVVLKGKWGKVCLFSVA